VHINKEIGYFMRIRYDLNGLWFFQKDPQMLGDQQQWFQQDNYQYIEAKYEIPVPGCWNVTDKTLEDFVGTAWYFRQFSIPPEFNGKRASLCFSGVKEKAEVFLDGKNLGIHEGGYTSFSFDITGLYDEEPHFLAVKVTNPKECGGIHDDVYIEFSDWIYLDDLILTQEIVWNTDNNPKMAKITIKSYFKNDTDKEWNGAIHFAISYDKVMLVELDRDFNVQHQNSRLLTTVFQLDNPQLWSPSDPHLYDLTTEVKDTSGKVFEQFTNILGIREFMVSGNHLLLNQKPIQFNGIEHEFKHKDFGLSLPKATIIRELKQFKERNINAIRLSKHPESSFTLEMMCRLGFLVIEEAGLLDYNTSFADKILKEIIVRDRNLPCILSWNLIRSEDQSRTISLELIKTWIQSFKSI
jgi:beta-galactosidase/beta-glucuronidase